MLKFKAFTLGYLFYTLLSPLNTLAQRDKLFLYPKNLGPLIKGILIYSTRIEVITSLPVDICLNQLPSNTNLRVITLKITSNLPISYIAIQPLKITYCSPLGLIPKLNKTFYYIYNLSSPKSRLGLSVNTTILKAYFTLTYSTVDEILVLILLARRGAVILKYNLKDAFQNILITITDQRLLGFKQEKIVYTKYYLPFSLATVLFFFNLFTEALYQILKYRLYLIIAFFILVHYLNNFIFILYLGISYTLVIYIYNFIITLLSFPFNTTKDFYGIVSDILGY